MTAGSVELREGAMEWTTASVAALCVDAGGRGLGAVSSEQSGRRLAAAAADGDVVDENGRASTAGVWLSGSESSYASTYFGFVIDLPIALDGHRVMLPLMPPGQHALLAIGFQEGRRSGTFLITASEPPNPLHEMSEDERKAEFQAWSKGNPSRADHATGLADAHREVLPHQQALRRRHDAAILDVHQELPDPRESYFE